MDKFNLYSVDFTILGPLCAVQGPSRHGQVQPVWLGCHGTGLLCTVQGPHRHETSSACTAWTSLYRDPSIQYKASPDMDKFSLYCSDLKVQGLICTVQGPLQTWISSTCTAWTSFYRAPSIQYKAPEDMDKFNLYSLDLIVQGLLCTVQSHCRHGQVSACTAWNLTLLGPLCAVQCPSRHVQLHPVQRGPHHTGTLCAVQGPSKHG